MGLSAPDFLVIPVLFCHLGVPSCLVGVLCAFSLAATRFRKRSAFCILHASSCRSRSAWWCLSSASCFCRSASSCASCSTVSCISCGMASYLRCTITCLCRSTSWLRWLASRSHGSVACLFRLALPLVLDHPPPVLIQCHFLGLCTLHLLPQALRLSPNPRRLILLPGTHSAARL
jgi:hypothetical protein